MTWEICKMSSWVTWGRWDVIVNFFLKSDNKNPNTFNMNNMHGASHVPDIMCISYHIMEPATLLFMFHS